MDVGLFTCINIRYGSIRLEIRKRFNFEDLAFLKVTKMSDRIKAYLRHIKKEKPGKGMQYILSCCPKAICNKSNWGAGYEIANSWSS